MPHRMKKKTCARRVQKFRENIISVEKVQHKSPKEKVHLTKGLLKCIYCFQHGTVEIIF